MDFIDEMIESIKTHQNTLDMPVFLNFLKEELDKAGIELTITRREMPPVTGTCILASNIIGIRLDLSEHDKKKDAEIEKYKKLCENEKCENVHEKLKHQNEIDELQVRIRELKESREELPIEPIKVADWLIERRRKDDEPTTICEMAYCLPIYSTSGLREIAEYLTVYCNHNTRE